MIRQKLSPWWAAGVAFVALLGGAVAIMAMEPPAQPKQISSSEPLSVGVVQPGFENEVCLGCHGMEEFAVPREDGALRPLHISPDRFGQSVHGKRACVECHKDIAQIPHEKKDRQVGCVQCHQALWEQAQKDGQASAHQRLGVVVKQIDSYMKSVHARPSEEDQSRTNATCYNCHNAHYIAPPGSQARAESHKSIPDTCGKCHVKQRADYLTSVHGKEVMEKNNLKAATCEDCHTTHSIDSPKADDIKLVITKNCGGCHDKQLATYMGTYHGQVNKLGYAYTAKCFDCHGSHTIQRVGDPGSTVHPDNRLQTCRKCHENATEGFVSFYPHGNTHDRERYPAMWYTSTFMIGLLVSVFAFFWTHLALWFYREWKDRKEGKNQPHVRLDGLPNAPVKHFRRFSKTWRLLHLILVLGVMTLVLTGMTVLYGDSWWAPTVIQLLGGPEMAAKIHRVGALMFIGVFFTHLLVIVACIIRGCRTWAWFGPRSLLPRWQDFKDAAAMFRWFLGKSPRPQFDRYTYWEKFDYWAPFWGLTIVGVSGAMMWFPEKTASALPGWVFNVGIIVHGEEAFLAAVFLFTVHFFNSHFRPDKFPMDIAMFTGTVPLEEYKHEHALEYERLVKSGELAKHLVDAPSRPLTRGSKILGATLLVIGLIELVFVLSGFIQTMLK